MSLDKNIYKGYAQANILGYDQEISHNKKIS